MKHDTIIFWHLQMRLARTFHLTILYHGRIMSINISLNSTNTIQVEQSKCNTNYPRFLRRQRRSIDDACFRSFATVLGTKKPNFDSENCWCDDEGIEYRWSWFHRLVRIWWHLLQWPCHRRLLWSSIGLSEDVGDRRCRARCDCCKFGSGTRKKHSSMASLVELLLLLLILTSCVAPLVKPKLLGRYCGIAIANATVVPQSSHEPFVDETHLCVHLIQIVYFSTRF